MTLFCIVSALLRPGTNPESLFRAPLVVGMLGARARVGSVEPAGSSKENGGSKGRKTESEERKRRRRIKGNSVALQQY